ncbi:MAG: divergent polysaccharide deacetylase family protein [Deltaproteobacteria bacterium]|nr:divergent polysaccharide deacetylase family protein [Deltaproteobacteria bacterium]
MSSKQPKKRTKRSRTRKKRPRKDSPQKQLKRALLGISLLLFVVFLGAWLVGRFLAVEQKQTAPPSPVRRHVVQEDLKAPRFEIFPSDTNGARTEPPKALVPAKPPGLPQVAIIIDDVGYDLQIATQLIALSDRFTLSILPFSPFQDQIVAAAQVKGLETMLHLPMEPKEYPHVNPGPGALFSSMTPDELIDQLTLNIRSIPGIKGVNNHMGSRMTEVSTQVYQILSILKREGLYFVDSRTTAQTLCKPSARLLQVPFAERDVFLDHEPDSTFIEKQLDRLIMKAERQGWAVGIAHPHVTTYQVLKNRLPQLKEKVKLVPASQIVGKLG